MPAGDLPVFGAFGLVFAQQFGLQKLVDPLAHLLGGEGIRRKTLHLELEHLGGMHALVVAVHPHQHEQ